MKVVIKSENGTLTWEPDAASIRTMKAAKVNEKERAKNLSATLKSLLEVINGLIAITNLGFPGTPQEAVAFLNEVEADIRRLIANYLRLHS